MILQLTIYAQGQRWLLMQEKACPWRFPPATDLQLTFAFSWTISTSPNSFSCLTMVYLLRLRLLPNLGAPHRRCRRREFQQHGRWTGPEFCRIVQYRRSYLPVGLDHVFNWSQFSCFINNIFQCRIGLVILFSRAVERPTELLNWNTQAETVRRNL